MFSLNMLFYIPAAYLYNLNLLCFNKSNIKLSTHRNIIESFSFYRKHRYNPQSGFYFQHKETEYKFDRTLVLTRKKIIEHTKKEISCLVSSTYSKRNLNIQSSITSHKYLLDNRISQLTLKQVLIRSKCDVSISKSLKFSA